MSFLHPVQLPLNFLDVLGAIMIITGLLIMGRITYHYLAIKWLKFRQYQLRRSLNKQFAAKLEIARDKSGDLSFVCLDPMIVFVFSIDMVMEFMNALVILDDMLAVFADYERDRPRFSDNATRMEMFEECIVSLEKSQASELTQALSLNLIVLLHISHDQRLLKKYDLVSTQYFGLLCRWQKQVFPSATAKQADLNVV